MTPDLELSVQPDLESLGRSGAALEAFLEALQLPPRGIFAALLTLEELGSNIIKYGAPQEAPVGFQLSVQVQGRTLVLRFTDSGAVFDPTVESRVDISELERAPAGGRGLMLVQRLSKAMRYRRESGNNVLEVELDLPPDKD